MYFSLKDPVQDVRSLFEAGAKANVGERGGGGGTTLIFLFSREKHQTKYNELYLPLILWKRFLQ